MALLSENPNTSAPITQDEVKGFGNLLTDSAALRVVVQDFDSASAWLHSKQWALRWRECHRLYESVPKIEYWEGTNIPRAHITTFTVAQHVQSLSPQIINALFGDDPPFVVQPRPGTKQETARAITNILEFQIEDCGFRQEIENGVQDCLTFGTNIWKWGWESTTRKRCIYERKQSPIRVESGDGLPVDTVYSDDEEIVEKEIDQQVERPTFESLNLRHVFVDPGCRVPDVRKAKFVIHRIKMTATELDGLRDIDGYQIPSKQELMALLFPPKETAPGSPLETTETAYNFDFQAKPRDQEEVADPTEAAEFELLERWDNHKVITVLNRKLVIRNERNPYGELPFCSMVWWKVPNSFYGLGLGHTLRYEQLLQAGTINARLDQMALNLNRGFIRVKGKTVATQNIRMRPGAVLDVDSIDSIKPMDKIDAVPEAYVEVQASEARAEGLSGANELMVQGNMPDKGRTSLGRTATGANLLAGGSQSRLGAFVERLGSQVFVPTLNAFHEMNRALLPMAVLHRLLNEELQEAYLGDRLDILNARINFDVLAAARMQERQQMAQSLPFLIQTLLTDPVHAMLTQQNKKVDVNEIVNMFMDVSRWRNKNQIIVDMTPEEQQNAAMNNPAVQQLLMQQRKTQAETQGKLQVVDSENAARAYRELQRQVIEHQLQTEAETGQPANSGLGT